ncbi:MAG: phosphodiester glycosidase family protein [Patescibacteria group bacterium]
MNHKIFIWGILLIGLIIIFAFVLPAEVKAATYSGWEATTVLTEVGPFSIRYIRVDLDNPRLKVYTLTTTSGDCDTCGVNSLASYVNSVNGFAGINGSYFCPADYGSCAGQPGSYFWMWYNSLTSQFTNSFQNQFNDQGGAIAFDQSNNYHFYRRSSDWPGKTASASRFTNQTGQTLQAAFSNGPVLVYENNFVVEAGQLDSKQLTVKSNRSGMGFKNNDVYLVVASGATVLDLGYIMAALDMEHAINLDGGGSSALYYNGQYRAGPGRSLPNAIVFAEESVPDTDIAKGTSYFAYAPEARGGYHVTAGNVKGDNKEEIITGTGPGMGPHVRIFNNQGKLQSQFFAFNQNLRNGVNVAACDVNNDGYDEIVTAQGPGGAAPLVKIYDWQGRVINNGFYVLNSTFTGGINLSCGNLDGKGPAELVVAAQRGGGAHVMAYDITGHPVVNFFAYDQSFRGGINVATLDMNSDGRDEIVTGPQYGAPHVQIFEIKPNLIKRVSPGFYAFDPAYRGGVDVGGADIDGDGRKEILVSRGNDATPLVAAYNNHEILQKAFFAYSTGFTGGVQVAGGDVDGDMIDEIIVIPRSGGGPNVRIIDPFNL